MSNSLTVLVCLFVLASACNKASSSNPDVTTSVSASAMPPTVASHVAAVAANSPSGAVQVYPLPGVSGPVTLDLFAYDRATGQVWIPVGETGSVDVFTIATSTFSRVDGFKTTERESHGHKRMMGPSAAAVGDGVVYVSNRSSSEVCVVNAAALKRGPCFQLESPPDVIAYVAGAKEVWVTTPKLNSIVVLDATRPDELKTKLVVKTEGAPECYAVDALHDLFYTNLEDKNRTVSIDIKTHAVKATWTLGCSDGPRGIAVDAARNFVFVACTDGLEVRDGAHDGALLGNLDTGGGVDAIDYLDANSRLYVAAGKAARLTTVQFSDKGVPAVATPRPQLRERVTPSSIRTASPTLWIPRPHGYS